MKRVITLLLLVILIATLESCQKSDFEAIVTEEPALKSAQTGQTAYIVTFRNDFLNDELNNLPGYEGRQRAMQVAAERALQSAGIFGAEIEFVYSTALKGFSVKIPPGQVSRLRQINGIQSIEEDQVVSLIEPFSRVETQSTATGTSLQPFPWGITRVKGGVEYRGSNAAWVIDSGIDLKHPDLNVDTNRSRTFIARTDPNDQNGHGTHVAGTIAAINNDFGVVGVAAGAPVVSVRVLDRNGSGTISGVIAGVDYVAANAKPGDVANMSLGGGASTSLDQAVINASEKCYFVLAAGNSSTIATTTSPARVNGTNIYTVSAMGANDNWASFSNYGNPPIDFCAPGVSIYSTYMRGGYATLSGTSMAAPHVAGILLLGDLKEDGKVKNDPDGQPDPIAIFGGTVAPEPENPGPGTGDESDDPETHSITLTASSAKVKGLRTVTLSWSGGKPGDSSTITRNGTTIATIINDGNGNGSFTDNLGRTGGTMVYKVCDATGCSNEVSVD